MQNGNQTDHRKAWLEAEVNRLHSKKQGLELSLIFIFSTIELCVMHLENSTCITHAQRIDTVINVLKIATEMEECQSQDKLKDLEERYETYLSKISQE